MIVVKARFRLGIKGNVRRLIKTIKNKNLKDTLSSFEKYHDSTYSVAWIDCLSTGKNFGRSVFMLGEHCQKDDLKNRKILGRAVINP